MSSTGGSGRDALGDSLLPGAVERSIPGCGWPMTGAVPRQWRGLGGPRRGLGGGPPVGVPRRDGVLGSMSGSAAAAVRAGASWPPAGAPLPVVAGLALPPGRGWAVRPEGGGLDLPFVWGGGRRGDTALALWGGARSTGRAARSRHGCSAHAVRWTRQTLACGRRLWVAGVGWQRRGGGAARQAAATASGGRQRPCHAEERPVRCLTTAAAPCPPGGARRHAGRRGRPRGAWRIVGSRGGGWWRQVAAAPVAGCAAGGGPAGAAGWPSSGGWCRC